MGKKICAMMMSMSLVCLFTAPIPCFGEPDDIQRPAELKDNIFEKVQPGKSSQDNKISLDIKGMDIVEVLKLISKSLGVSVVTSKEVRGPVTLFLKDVGVQDAFEVVIASNDLAYEHAGNIISVMTEREYQMLYGKKFRDKTQAKIIPLKYAKAAGLSLALNQAKTPLGRVIADEGSNTIIVIDTPESIADMEQMIESIDMPTRTEVFSLKYSVSKDIKDKITELITKGVGSVQIDERTNKIIVTDLEPKLKDIRRIISELDEKSKEVLIEAKIVQITLNNEYRAGINWDAVFKGIDINTGADLSTISNAIIPTAGSGTPLGAAIAIGSLADKHFQATIKALETLGKTNILSSPRIIALNNQEAKILVGKNQPYATSTTTIPSSGSPVRSYQITYLDLGVKLYVTPTINKDNFVTMKIKPEVSSKDTDYTYGEFKDTIPVVKTSQAETTVMVKDGTTIIIAGLMENRDEEAVSKVPILGDIPILNMLFKSRTRGSATDPVKTEIVVFLTPHIISGDHGFEGDEEYTDNTSPSALAVDMVKSVDVIKPEKGAGEATDYEVYYKNIRAKIYKKVSVNSGRLGTIKGEANVNFRLNREGYLKGEPLVMNSTDEKLGDLVVDCVRQSSPFPPFPSGLDKDEEVFTIAISCE